MREPPATFFLYQSGLCTSTGSPSPEACRVSTEKLYRQLQKAGLNDSDSEEDLRSKAQKKAHITDRLRFDSFRITNQMAITHVNHRVNIPLLAYDYSSVCSYEPDISKSAEFDMGLKLTFNDAPSASTASASAAGPALAKTRTEIKHVSIRIFASGKLVIPKAESRDLANHAVNALADILSGYKIWK
jgi:TATA-box binding protein (TBP) (component of TFIID and TFIIIB)